MPSDDQCAKAESNEQLDVDSNLNTAPLRDDHTEHQAPAVAHVVRGTGVEIPAHSGRTRSPTDDDDDGSPTKKRATGSSADTVDLCVYFRDLEHQRWVTSRRFRFIVSLSPAKRSLELVGLSVRSSRSFFILCAYRLRDYATHNHKTYTI